jgi:hypothetical protein
MKKRKTRSLVVANIAREVVQKIDVKELGSKLKNPMELSHFLQSLENMLAILIHMEQAKQ